MRGEPKLPSSPSKSGQSHPYVLRAHRTYSSQLGTRTHLVGQPVDRGVGQLEPLPVDHLIPARALVQHKGVQRRNAAVLQVCLRVKLRVKVEEGAQVRVEARV